MPRFVILEHDHPVLHWDFMLETGTVLRTWRLAEAPGAGRESIHAAAIGDHRLAYLDYEGLVSGGRGRVLRWDGGVYDVLSEGKDRLELRLSGSRLCGIAAMQRLAEDSWQFQLRFDTA